MLFSLAILFFNIINFEDVACFLSLPNDDDSDYLKYWLYNRYNGNSPDILIYHNDTSLVQSRFKSSKDTVVYIHGYSESVFSKGPQNILEAYLTSTNFNIILVDWSKKSKAHYLTEVLPAIPIIGLRIAKMMKWLRSHSRIRIENLHVIGFSLGAHIAGYMAEALKPRKVRRITGLDPPFLKFLINSYDRQLNRLDAKFVDVIHTSGGYKVFFDRIFLFKPIGHADFYPNGGEFQENCWKLVLKCHHRQAYIYYANSVRNYSRYPSQRCKMKDDEIVDCNNETTVYMGYHADSYKYGVFYVDSSKLGDSD